MYLCERKVRITKMSKFSDQQECIQEAKAKNKFAKETLSKTILNMGVVTYTGLVIGCFAAVIQGAVLSWQLILIALFGLLASIGIISLGYKISKQ